MKRPGRPLVATLALAVGLTVTACSEGLETLDQPGARPEPRPGKPQAVDPCDLVTPADVADVLESDVDLVSSAYTASELPTRQCGLGRAFAKPLVTVQFTGGPIALMVFNEAYGDQAGGDPTPVEELGTRSVLRTEGDERSLHALVHGGIVSLITPYSRPAAAVQKKKLVELAELAVDRVPRNPVLAPAARGSLCGDVDDAAVAAAVGIDPIAVSEHDGPRGSVMCSWAGQPGVASVTVLHDRAEAARWRRLVEEPIFEPVTELPGTAYSRTDQPGDLLVLVDSATVATINVTPAAGFADDEVDTTEGERTLAAAILSSLV